jgi:hypothetical protein
MCITVQVSESVKYDEANGHISLFKYHFNSLQYLDA